MTARLADDASFAAELKARQTTTPVSATRSAAESRPPAVVAGTEEPASAEEPATYGDEDAPEWPDPETEAAMRVEVQEREALAAPPAARRPARVVETLGDEELPKLDDAVQRVPAAVRQMLDELFRAQFVQVRRVPAAVLKDDGESADGPMTEAVAEADEAD